MAVIALPQESLVRWEADKWLQYKGMDAAISEHRATSAERFARGAALAHRFPVLRGARLVGDKRADVSCPHFMPY